MYSALNESKGVRDIKYKEPHSRATVKIRPNGYSQDLIYILGLELRTPSIEKGGGEPQNVQEVGGNQPCKSLLF